MLKIEIKILSIVLQLLIIVTNGVCGKNRNVNNLGMIEIMGDFYEIRQISGLIGKIYSMRVDSKNNIYFRDYANVVYILRNDTTEPVPIETSGGSFDIAVDVGDNVYLANSGGVYQLALNKTEQNELLEGPARSVYADNDYLYWGFLSGGIYRVSSCLINQLRRYYYKSRISNDSPCSFETLKEIVKDSADKIYGVSDLVKKLAVSSKGHIFYVKNDSEDAFILERGSLKPRKIYMGNRIIYDVKVDAEDNVYFAGIQGLYVYRSNEANSWSIIKVNLTVGDLYTVYPHGKNIYLGGDGAAYKLERIEKMTKNFT